MSDTTLKDAVSAAIGGDSAAQRWLGKHAASRPLPRVLFEDDPSAHADCQRLLPRLAPIYHSHLDALGIAPIDSVFFVDVLVPLTHFLALRIAARPGNSLIGLGGGPGAGKTTLSRLLCACLPVACDDAPTCLNLSLDDFYRSRAERLRLGFKWRTLPGTHDTDRLAQFVQAFDRGDTPFAVPRYDLGLDAPAADDILKTAPGVCVFDGAMVGSRLPGYDVLAGRIDTLIYLDAPVSLLKRWRFDRERRLRDRSGGAAGFSPTEMAAFWREALRPSIDRWVLPNAANADIRIDLGPGRAVRNAHRAAAPNRKAHGHD